MEAPRSDARSSVLRLALALPLACAVIIGALWLGQSLRTYREPAAPPAPSEEPGAQAGASPAPQPLPPMQSIDLPPDVARNAGAPVPNADGTYLVGQTADYKSLAVIRLIADRDALNLKSEVVAAVADTGFLAWMPDGKSFIARGNTVVNTASGKAQMKMNDVFRVDLAGQRTKLGEAWLVSSSLSPDARLLAAFDGDMRLVVIRTDGGGMQLVANDQGGAPSLLGWDGSGAILRFDERGATIHRIPTAGAALRDLPVNGARYIGGITRWSPDRRAAIVSATVTTSAGVCECDRLLTDGVVDMPRDAFAVWVGPHTLLTRASDEHAGTVDALSGARATLNAKMRSEKIRIIAVSLPYVMWLDETKNVAHILDLAKDRDTGVGLNDSPAGAYPLNGGRFLWWRDRSLSILNMSAWWAFYVDAHPTPSPIPQSKDQSAVPAGYVRVERPEGGWSAVMPKSWYRRDAPLHGSEFLSYDPEGMDSSGNAPPTGETRVVLRMENDYGAADLRTFASTYPAGPMGKNDLGADTQVAGQPAYTTTFVSAQPPPWNAPMRIWFLRSPYFVDRVVTVTATNTRMQEVDAIVQSLRFFKPAPPAALTVTRAEVIAKYSKPSFSATRVDRVEAKLVRWKDYEKARGGFRSYTNDPDELTWVVIVYGEIKAQGGRGGPLRVTTPDPNATPQTFKYETHAFSATGAEGGMYGCCGPDGRPTWFDTLVDLAK